MSSSPERHKDDADMFGPLSSPFFAEDSMRNARSPLHVQITFPTGETVDLEPELRTTSSVGADGQSGDLYCHYSTLNINILIIFFADIKGDALDLSGQIVKCEEYPAAHGGFADVWKCDWTSETGKRKVNIAVSMKPSSH